jgi:hypothetical protein
MTATETMRDDAAVLTNLHIGEQSVDVEYITGGLIEFEGIAL